MPEILHQLIGSLSHYLQGLYLPGGAGFLPSTVCHSFGQETFPCFTWPFSPIHMAIYHHPFNFLGESRDLGTFTLFSFHPHGGFSYVVCWFGLLFGVRAITLLCVLFVAFGCFFGLWVLGLIFCCEHFVWVCFSVLVFNTLTQTTNPTKPNKHKTITHTTKPKHKTNKKPLKPKTTNTTTRNRRRHKHT